MYITARLTALISLKAKQKLLLCSSKLQSKIAGTILQNSKFYTPL